MMTRFVELKEIFRILHSPAGCPWDRKQTYRSLIPHLREEVEEYIEAVKSGDRNHMKEELGDILLHILFNAELASREGSFDIEDVIEVLVMKLKRRHPHVFGTAGAGRAKSIASIIKTWDEIKAGERAALRKGRMKKAKGKR